jgi:hypothetical protein
MLLSVVAALLSVLSVGVVVADGSCLPASAPGHSPGADLPRAQPLLVPLDPAVVARERGDATPENETLAGQGGLLPADALTGRGVHVGSATWFDDGMGRPMQDQTVVVPLIPTAEGRPVPAASHLEATYEIEGRAVTLTNGVAVTEAAPGSASMVTTQYFGNEATGYLDGDETADVTFRLTQSTGGSRTFFYVVAALNTPEGYVRTNGVLLGDRIAPQTTMVEGRDIIVTYAERQPGEPGCLICGSRWDWFPGTPQPAGEVDQSTSGADDVGRPPHQRLDRRFD